MCSVILKQVTDVTGCVQMNVCLWQDTQEPACLRLFLDYHGLPLLWSWMADSSQEDEELKFLVGVFNTNVGFRFPECSECVHEFRLCRSAGNIFTLCMWFFFFQILFTLKSLPINNKTVLKESKILTVVSQLVELESMPVKSEADSNTNSDVLPLPSTTSIPVSILASTKDSKDKHKKKKVTFADEATSSDSDISDSSKITSTQPESTAATESGSDSSGATGSFLDISFKEISYSDGYVDFSSEGKEAGGETEKSKIMSPPQDAEVTGKEAAVVDAADSSQGSDEKDKVNISIEAESSATDISEDKMETDEAKGNTEGDEKESEPLESDRKDMVISPSEDNSKSSTDSDSSSKSSTDSDSKDKFDASSSKLESEAAETENRAVETQNEAAETQNEATDIQSEVVQAQSEAAEIQSEALEGDEKKSLSVLAIELLEQWSSLKVMHKYASRFKLIFKILLLMLVLYFEGLSLKAT